MIRVSRELPINEPGEPVVLNRHQVWQGLEMKGRDAVPFVPSITECRVLEEWDGGYLREIVHVGERLREALTLIPERVIHFRRISDRTPGDIFNELYTNDEGELMMAFTIALDLPEVEPGTIEAKALADSLEDSYLRSIKATLAHLRSLAKDGQI